MKKRPPKVFLGKYRIESLRRPAWNYGSNACYFITICTWKRKCFFGEIVNDKMILSAEGKIAQENLNEIPVKFPHIKLDIGQIMPNHLHGIFKINEVAKITKEQSKEDQEKQILEDFAKEKQQIINGGITGLNNPMLYQNLSTALRRFTATCSCEIHRFNPAFRWQPRFHDHIIRDPESYENIYSYIEANPKNWKNDRFYSA